ncbi:MAG: hypothetical protein LBQ66_16570, partial [Planctomycetaceae bacterium]|nr:hypothetical protein [Planctomycetaceae bacterium]
MKTSKNFYCAIFFTLAILTFSSFAASFVLAQNKPAEAAKLPPFKVSKLAGIDARFVFSIIADNK